MVIKKYTFYDKIYVYKKNNKVKKYKVPIKIFNENQISRIEYFFRCYWDVLSDMSDIVEVYKENKKFPKYILRDIEKYKYKIEQCSKIEYPNLRIKKKYKYKQGR